MFMMNNYKYGDIILLNFPFSNISDIKKRPALVLVDSEDNDILVCRITGQIYNSIYDILIKDYLAIGLKISSVIRIHKIATLEKSMISKKLGELNKFQKNEVFEKLKLLFNL